MNCCNLMKKPSSDTLQKAVVLAASCVTTFLIYGTIRLSGQLFPACRERFNVGRREAALPFVLAFTVRNICGPFVGYLGNKLGLQCVTILGCALTAISVGSCYLAEDIITLTVLWGGCVGFGCGMASTLIINILHIWFKSNFNKVQGISIASGCVGSFVLPGITDYLLETYGTSGTFLIISGFVLHGIPVAMLLKEPSTSQQTKIQTEIKVSYRTKQIYTEIKTVEDIPSPPNREVSTQQTSQTTFNSPGTKYKEVLQFSSLQKYYTSQGATNGEISYRSPNVTEETNLSEKNTLSKVEDQILPTKFKSPSTKYKEVLQFSKSQKDYPSQSAIKGEIFYRSSNAIEETNLSEKNTLSKVEDPTAITTEVNRNEEHNQKVIVRDTESKKKIHYSEKRFDVSDDEKNPTSMVKQHSQPHSMSRNFQVFLDATYILILISLSSATVVVVSMYTVIVDACRDKGITEDVTVLMTFAIAEMLGRIIFGFVADGVCLSPLNIYALCCGFCGLLMIGLVWLDNFYVVLVFIAGIGALMGGIIVGPAGIIRDYIKKEDITMAFSARYFLFGLLNIPQPLVIGYFRETLHSYAGLFYLLGSMCLLSSIIALLIPSAARFRDRKKRHVT